MSQVRTFRWPSGNGFDVVGEDVCYFEDGVRGRRTVDWDLEELEGYANSTDPLQETTAKAPLAQVHNTRVFLVDGEVVDVEDARALYNSLREALNEWDGEQKKPLSAVDREARVPDARPDFPGQIVVEHTWTQDNESDGWVRVQVHGTSRSEPHERTHLKIREHLLRTVQEAHGSTDW